MFAIALDAPPSPFAAAARAFDILIAPPIWAIAVELMKTKVNATKTLRMAFLGCCECFNLECCITVYNSILDWIPARREMFFRGHVPVGEPESTSPGTASR
jgi:hypothetical protein